MLLNKLFSIVLSSCSERFHIDVQLVGRNREKRRKTWLASCSGKWDLSSIDMTWPWQMNSPYFHHFNGRKRHCLSFCWEGNEGRNNERQKGGRWSLDYKGMWFPSILQWSFCGFQCVGVLERHSAFFHTYTSVLHAYSVFITFII